MPYSLLVCDLDGTLIDHTLLLAPELVGAFRRASEAGLRISIATGRMPAATVRYRDELMIRAPVIYYNGALVRDYCDEEGLRAEVIPDPSDFLSLGAFVKSLLIGHPEALPVVREELEGVVGEGAKLLRTRSNYLEVVPVSASKGSALARLAEHLGIPLERVIAVGDQENDLEMIQAAGMGVAMPHAPELVRAAADRVAPAPEAGGLLALFRELIPEYFA